MSRSGSRSPVSYASRMACCHKASRSASLKARYASEVPACRPGIAAAMGLDEEAHRGVAYADVYPMAHLEQEAHMAISTQYDVDIADVEYLRHGDTPLLATLFKPRGN